MTRQPSIFISYATPDRERVLEVYKFLLDNGYPNTWIDCERLLPGQNWDFEIRRNLQKADIVLIFFSNNSIIRRGYVQREIKLVLKNLEEKLIDDIYTIPVRIHEEAEIPEALSDLQWLDINSEDAHNKLKDALDSQIKKLGLEISVDTDDQSSDTDNVIILEDIQLKKLVIKESWEGIPGYDVEYELPNFASEVYRNISEITKIIEAKFISSLHEYRSLKLDQMPDSYNWAQNKSERTNTFDASYGNIYKSYNVISFHYTIHWYGAGTAHPNYYFNTFNFFLNPLISIDSIEYLFEPQDDLLGRFVTIVKDRLTLEVLERINSDEDDIVIELDDHYIESINRNVKDWNDLSCFTFSDEGLSIFFEPYHVFSYAMGSFVINISYRDLPGTIKKIFTDALPVNRSIYRSLDK